MSNRISESAAKAMHERHLAGLSLRQLSAEFELSRSGITQAFKRHDLHVRPSNPEIARPVVVGNCALIPLSGERADGRSAIIDLGDCDLVAAHRWHICEVRHADGRVDGPYAITSARLPGGSGKTKIFMHALITGYARTDHRNHNGLDNRRSNLRPTTTAQNNHNQRPQRNTSSKYKGVTWHRRAGKWQAAIKVNGKCVYLGCFLSETDAADAYDDAAVAAYGEYAYLNRANASDAA